MGFKYVKRSVRQERTEGINEERVHVRVRYATLRLVSMGGDNHGRPC